MLLNIPELETTGDRFPRFKTVSSSSAPAGLIKVLFSPFLKTLYLLTLPSATNSKKLRLKTVSPDHNDSDSVFKRQKLR